MMRVLLLILLLASPVFAADWYVRTDGAASPTCNGQSDASAASTPNCAFANPQEAINAASLGDTINLRAGDTFTGNFTLPLKAGVTYLTIQSSAVGSLPAGVRVSPAQSASFANLRSNNVDPVIATAADLAVHHYKFIGISFTNTVNNSFNIIRLGDLNQSDPLLVPEELQFDRCYIFGQPTLNVQRGVLLHSANTTITNSYISDIHWVGAETQALAGYNGPGPFTISNNYIEAAGINILFGGATPSIPNVVPSDITITNNYLYKPLTWRVGDPSYAGIHWNVKNLFELKNARRVTITNNVMENAWPDGQIGWAVIFNTFKDGGWEVVEDVTMTHNTFLNTTYGLDMRGVDSPDTVVRLKRITVEDNYFTNLGAYALVGVSSPIAFLMLGGSEDVTINHNTVSGTVSQALGFGGTTNNHTGFNFSNQLMPFGTYGVFGDGGFFGTAALNQFAGTGNWTYARNALYGDMNGQTPSQYPTNNYFPVNLAAAIGLPGTDGYPVGVRNTSQICRWNTTPACQ